jgi:hypothetical protein
MAPMSSNAATNGNSGVPGFAKHVSTPEASRLHTTDSAPVKVNSLDAALPCTDASEIVETNCCLPTLMRRPHNA